MGLHFCNQMKVVTFNDKIKHLKLCPLIQPIQCRTVVGIARSWLHSAVKLFGKKNADIALVWKEYQTL